MASRALFGDGPFKAIQATPIHDDNIHVLSDHLIGSRRFDPLSDVRTILITGGAGFLGSWVTRHMAAQYSEYEVICFDKMDDISSENNIASLRSLPNFRFIKGDITDMRSVYWSLDAYEVDCIMHFAANSHVQDSFNDPFPFTHNNVIGTHVLLEAARTYGKIKRFVHVSTDEVYGETHGVFATESQQFAPTNPYSASKAAAEMYVNAYHKSFGLPVIVVRSNNIYGPCQYPQKIIPTFIKLAKAGKKLTLQGTGTNTRRYLYGSDAADAFDTILHHGTIGEVYNIGSQFEVENRVIAAEILQILGVIPEADVNSPQFQKCIEWIADRPFNDSEYRVKGGKLEALGWSQRIGFHKGLRLTVDWYLKHMNTWWLGSMVYPFPTSNRVSMVTKKNGNIMFTKKGLLA